MRRIVPLLVLITFLGCQKENSTHMYVGGYRMSDQLIPYPYILHVTPSQIQWINNKGVVIDSLNVKENKVLKDTLSFSRHTFYVENENNEKLWLFDLNDTINFRRFKNKELSPKHFAVFNRIKKHSDISIDEVKHGLMKNYWSYKEVQDENSTPNDDLEVFHKLRFDKDSVNDITKYMYKGTPIISQSEVKAYTVFTLDGVNFLSFDKGSDNPQSIYQINSLDTNEMTIKDFSAPTMKTIDLMPINEEVFIKDQKTSTPYEQCYDGYQGEYYYGDDVTYLQGNEYVVNYVNTDIPIAQNDGYIMVHFVVNCKKQLGRFGLIQMDRFYKKTEFSNILISHIIQKVSELKDWPSTISPPRYAHYMDVHAFFMFKIRNGKIVDLCP